MKKFVIDEGAKDMLSTLWARIKGIGSDRELGRAQVLTLTKEAKGHFQQYMGRTNQTWGNVTWATLFKYLTMQGELELTADEALNLLQDSSTKSEIQKILTSQQMLSPDYFSKYWAKTKRPISGGQGGEKRAEVVISYILELAAMKNLDKRLQSSEMPDTTKKNRASPSAAPTGNAATSSTGTVTNKNTGSNNKTSPVAKPTKPTSTGDANKDNWLDAIYRLQMAAYLLQGGTP